MFQLNKDEFDILKSHFATTNLNWNKKRFYPYVFTEQGVAMTSGILNNKMAIEINIKIIKSFISMKNFLLENKFLFEKIKKLELNQFTNNKKINEIFKIIYKNNIKKQGIFYNGQIFDSYKFICDLLNLAKKEIILIDNYIDESVLILFSKLNTNVEIKIYTKNINSKLKLDINKFNLQYSKINLKKINKMHDRFLIIDKKFIYHFGASLKDLGNKTFAFSKISINITNFLKLIEK